MAGPLCLTAKSLMSDLGERYGVPDIDSSRKRVLRRMRRNTHLNLSVDRTDNQQANIRINTMTLTPDTGGPRFLCYSRPLVRRCL